MSLFGEKCTCCGKKISSLSKFQKISDGTICDICSQMCSPDLDSIELKTKEEIKLHINFRKRNYRQYKEFKPTNNISNIFLIDNVNKLFCMPKNRDDMNPDLFKFSELTKFELVEDGAVSSGGGLGTSIAGGLLFGGVGAIVGSNIASKKNYVNDMHIHLILKHPWVKSVTIGIITNNTAKGSIVYKTKKAEA
ncbi:hypothetical protein, partial [Aminipila sp.]|uniref:hypothetical protein n=1 Tax=Aminipila sp. TaxID=2060095 RepID=UPI002F4169DC